MGSGSGREVSPDGRSGARGPADARPPSVDALARGLRDVGLPHPLLVDAARAAIAAGDPARPAAGPRRRRRDRCCSR